MSKKKSVEDYLLKEESNKINLLPCPFCGGSASYSFRPAMGNNYLGYAKVSCDTCNAVVGISQKEFEDFMRDLVIAKWNRRISNEN